MLFRVSLTCGLFCFAVADSARAQNSVPAFGYAIVTHGDRVLVGAPEFAMEVKTPAIYLFQRVGEEHRLLRKFEVPGLAKHVRVGERIAIGKTAVATGAPALRCGSRKERARRLSTIYQNPNLPIRIRKAWWVPSRRLTVVSASRLSSETTSSWLGPKAKRRLASFAKTGASGAARSCSNTGLN